MLNDKTLHERSCHYFQLVTGAAGPHRYYVAKATFIFYIVTVFKLPMQKQCLN